MQDAADIERLLGACGLPAADLVPHLSNFLLAKAGADLAGVIGLEPAGQCGLLRSLAVAPEFRNRGIAGALHARMEKHAAEQGIRSLYLLTTTAEPFFAASGFARVGRDTVPEAIRSTREFSSLCPESAVVMVKPL
ncbi:MAG TPA: arsenic resistance N-acetyltransferase ArsN2 [Burkholderiales bacterium]